MFHYQFQAGPAYDYVKNIKTPIHWHCSSTRPSLLTITPLHSDKILPDFLFSFFFSSNKLICPRIYELVLASPFLSEASLGLGDVNFNAVCALRGRVLAKRGSLLGS